MTGGTRPRRRPRPGSPAAAALPGGSRVGPGEGRLPDEVPRQLRDHAAGIRRAFDMLGAGDFLWSAWEIIARGASGWTRDRGVITTGSR
jgi:hypothetical protein